MCTLVLGAEADLLQVGRCFLEALITQQTPLLAGLSWQRVPYCKVAALVAAATAHLWLLSVLASSQSGLFDGLFSAVMAGERSSASTLALTFATPSAPTPVEAPQALAAEPVIQEKKRVEQAVIENTVPAIPTPEVAPVAPAIETEIVESPVETTADEPLAVAAETSITREENAVSGMAEAAVEMAEAAAQGEAVLPMIEPVFASPPAAPRYPRLARKRGQEGTVWLDVLLDAEGRQEKRQIFQSSGLALLDQAALEAVSSWQGEPHRVNGLGLRSWVRIPVEFSLRSRR